MNLQGSVLILHPAGFQPVGQRLHKECKARYSQPHLLVGMILEIIVILRSAVTRLFTFSAASLATSITAKLPD